MFSIIIPLYNKAPYICRAIDSVLGQSFKEFEIIVINDGSTDGGEQLLEEKYGNQIQLIHQPNQGVSVARNKGIVVAKGDYIAFLDADDYWHKDYLRFVNQVISKHPDIGIIGTKYDSIELDHDPELEYIFLEDYFKRAIRNVIFFTSATVIRKTFFEQQSGFDSRLKLGEDIDVWLRAFLFFGKGIYINNKLVYYNQEDINAATTKDYHLEETLLGKILNADYTADLEPLPKELKLDFLKFRDKWILFTLFSAFRLKENERNIKMILNKMDSSYFIVHRIYQIPYPVLHFLFKRPDFSSLFRKYLKFCFRYIYS
ncbi:glycosyltransferase family A protein [Echinicola shivajiensis]|uniref:glycosyltransferase family A protein n=1 Tax=Echinicola shivajiensis TaxID=1035916 RepID=UPI001BFC86FC|nr:glycosyltransferase family A protein [Echinicola shivajiensis]